MGFVHPKGEKTNVRIQDQMQFELGGGVHCMEPAGTHCRKHTDAVPGSLFSAAMKEAGTRQYQLFSLNQQKAMT